MSVNIKVTLNDVPVTHLVDFETFPEWFEESMKGDGYFEFEVKPFVFTLITIGTDIVPARGDWVVITDSATNEQLLNGKIDEILNADSSLPEITVFPQALVLKDAMVGDTVALTLEDSLVGDTIEYVKQFIFGTQTLRTILTRVLNEVNAVHGSSMFTSAESVPASESGNQFFGDLLKIENSRLGVGVASFLYIRYTLGEYNLIEAINSSSFNVWRMQGSTLAFSANYETDVTFGPILEGNQATNVNEEQIIAEALANGFVSSIQGVDTTPTIQASFDYDDQSSFALVHGRTANGGGLSAMVLNFTTTTGNAFSGRYQNFTAMEIIRDLAVVSNRWFYVDRTGLVYLLPRNSSRGSISLTAGKTISAVKKIRAEQDTEIQVNRYVIDSEGYVTSWGLQLRDNQVEAIKLSYRVLLAEDITEWTLEMYDSIGDDILKAVSWDMKSELPTIGKVISIAHSLLDRRQRAVIEDGL